MRDRNRNPQEQADFDKLKEIAQRLVSAGYGHDGAIMEFIYAMEHVKEDS